MLFILFPFFVGTMRPEGLTYCSDLKERSLISWGPLPHWPPLKWGWAALILWISFLPCASVVEAHEYLTRPSRHLDYTFLVFPARGPGRRWLTLRLFALLLAHLSAPFLHPWVHRYLRSVCVDTPRDHTCGAAAHCGKAVALEALPSRSSQKESRHSSVYFPLTKPIWAFLFTTFPISVSN